MSKQTKTRKKLSKRHYRMNMLAQTDSNNSSNNNYNRKMVMSHVADESVDSQADTHHRFL